MKIFLQCGKPKVMNPIRSKPICFVGRGGRGLGEVQQKKQYFVLDFKQRRAVHFRIFYKNIFYKNIEAEIGEILRIFQLINRRLRF